MCISVKSKGLNVVSNQLCCYCERDREMWMICIKFRASFKTQSSLHYVNLRPVSHQDAPTKSLQRYYDE